MSQLYILSRPPQDPLMPPVLDMIFTAVAFGLAPSLVFCGDSTQFFTSTENSMHQKLIELGEYGEFHCYFLIEDDTASPVSLSSSHPSPTSKESLQAKAITAGELQALISQFNTVQSF